MITIRALWACNVPTIDTRDAPLLSAEEVYTVPASGDVRVGTLADGLPLVVCCWASTGSDDIRWCEPGTWLSTDEEVYALCDRAEATLVEGRVRWVR